MSLKTIVMSLLATASIAANAQFERFELNYNGEVLSGSLFSLEPRVGEFSTFVDGTYTRMIWADFGDGYEEVYSSVKDLTGLPGTAGDFHVAAGGGDVFLVDAMKTELGNRGEGAIFKLTPTGFTQYAPLATEALGQGAEGKFYYSFPAAADNGTVAMIGYDNRFPHFIVLATEGDIRIIAQESVTPYPGGGNFAQFGAALLISPDASKIVFRGESTTGANGIFLWTEEGIEKIADSTMTIPGTDQSFNRFIDSSIEARITDDGSVFLRNLEPRAVVAYQNGQLSTLLSLGDAVEGVPVEGITEFDLAPDGSIFIADFTRALRYQAGQWSVFQPMGNFETSDGKRLQGSYFVGPDGLYFTGSFFDLELRKNFISLYRREYDEGPLTRVLDLNEAVFGVPYTGGSINVMTDDEVVFRTSQGIFIGSTDVFNADPSTPDPIGLPENFLAAIANLPPELSGPLQDADLDGISNLAEYILGRQLNVLELEGFASDIQIKTGESLGIAGDTRAYLTFDVRIRTSIADAEISFQYNTDLSLLGDQVSAAVEVGSPLINGDFETRKFRSPIPVDESVSGFLGMVVQLNE